jgi:hypothetical protein
MSASIYAPSKAPRAKKRTFDCRLTNDLPELEIEARTEDEAKRLYIAAVIKALTAEVIDAVEVEII